MTTRSIVTAAVLLLTASALAGCASGPSAGSDGSGSGSGAGAATSEPVSLEGEWRAEAPDEAFLRFDADGAFRGTDGCNGLSGTATVSGDEVTFDLDLSTLRACVGLPTSFSDLGSAIVDGDVMLARAGDGSEIVQLRRQ